MQCFQFMKHWSSFLLAVVIIGFIWGHHSNKKQTRNPLKANFQMIPGLFFIGDPLGISNGGFERLSFAFIIVYINGLRFLLEQ